MKAVYEEPGNKLELLKVLYETQVQYLRWLSQIDLKLFTGFMAVQMVLAGWLLQRDAAPPNPQLIGMPIIDILMAFVACTLLWKNHRRRLQEIDTLKDVFEAIGYTVPGAYLTGRPLIKPPQSRTSLSWYIVGIVVSVGVVSLALFTSNIAPNDFSSSSSYTAAPESHLEQGIK